MISLHREFAALDHERFPQWFGKKFPGTDLKEVVGAALIKPQETARFIFDIEGQDAVVLQVGDHEENLSDLIAWLPKTPEHWWFRHYSPHLSLGQPLLNWSQVYQKPVDVFETPLEWLAAGGNGCCPLGIDAYAEYLRLPGLTCSARMRDRLEAEFDRLTVRPKIEVRK